MSHSSSLSARAVAAEVLRQFDPQRAYAGPILNRLIGRTEERQRATDLVFTTLRNLRAIDTVITEFSGRRIERITKSLLAVIRIGVCELIYSPESPPYSIVNEAVNTAKRTGGRKQTGFVNAVLRGILRHIVARRTELATANARRTLIQNLETGCTFDTDFLPDPQTDFAWHASATFSLPSWLVEEWLSEFGPERTRDICLASNRRPAVYVRVNPLKADATALLERFTAGGIQAIPASPGGDMLKVTAPQSVTKLPGFAEGLFTVQDISASNAVRMLDPQPHWTILDLCAAPGTKTTQLAELTQDSAKVVATDIDAERLSKLDENLARLGLRSVNVVPCDKHEERAPNTFDAVLLDVPCSNTGVLARRLEVRFRIDAASVTKLAQTQQSLLEEAASLVKPAGKICYSTCSIQRAENSDRVRAFLQAHPQFELAREELILPSAIDFDHDGAYAAILVRRQD